MATPTHWCSFPCSFLISSDDNQQVSSQCFGIWIWLFFAITDTPLDTIHAWDVRFSAGRLLRHMMASELAFDSEDAPFGHPVVWYLSIGRSTCWWGSCWFTRKKIENAPSVVFDLMSKAKISSWNYLFAKSWSREDVFYLMLHRARAGQKASGM